MPVMTARRVVHALPLLVLLACESATNLDVSYAGLDGGGDATPDAANPEPDAGIGEPALLDGCPCDQAAGLGCCVTSAGAFCTDDFTSCNGAKGEWLRCSKRDPAFESECCWEGSGTGAQTRFAVACKSGPTACLSDSDCSGTGQPCKTTTCSGFTFGQCAANAPSCPTP